MLLVLIDTEADGTPGPGTGDVLAVAHATGLAVEVVTTGAVPDGLAVRRVHRLRHDLLTDHAPEALGEALVQLLAAVRAEAPPDKLRHGHHVGGRPACRGRQGEEFAWFVGERVSFHQVEVGVDSGDVALDHLLHAVGEGGKLHLSLSLGVEDSAHLLVLLYCAKADFGETPKGGAAEDLHLYEAVARCCEALPVEECQFGRAFDVRDAVRITLDRHLRSVRSF